MNITYSDYALTRMRARGITKELVDKCIWDPDRVFVIILKGISIYMKKFNDRVIVVINKELGGADKLVITAYVSTKVNKYIPS